MKKNLSNISWLELLLAYSKLNPEQAHIVALILVSDLILITDLMEQWGLFEKQ